MECNQVSVLLRALKSFILKYNIVARVSPKEISPELFYVILKSLFTATRIQIILGALFLCSAIAA